MFLLLLILINSTGFTLAKHFCGETLAHVTLSDEVPTCCGDEEKEMPSDCCHDEFDQLVLDHSQLNHQTLQLQPLTFYTVSLLAHFFANHTNAPDVSPLWAAFHSPPPPDIAVYLRVQSFLI